MKYRCKQYFRYEQSKGWAYQKKNESTFKRGRNQRFCDVTYDNEQCDKNVGKRCFNKDKR